MKNPKIANNAAPIVAPTAPAVNPFAELLRAYESAYTSGGDYTAALTTLAAACARSVLRRCIDPQRTAAPTRDGVSNSGHSPAMVAMQRELTADAATLVALDSAGLAARSLVYNDLGDLASIVIDPDADAALDHAATVTLSDGIDLVHTAVVALLEQSADHADSAPGWLERTYTTRLLSRRVLIQSTDSAAWVDAETTPIQEVYRAVRRAVASSRAVQTDPRNGYSYIEDLSADPETDTLDAVYIRMGRYADIGGYNADGHYTADAHGCMEYNAILGALSLTKRQAAIVALRMRGYGYKAIAAYLGIDGRNVKLIVRRIRAKCEKIGFTPDMWAEMHAEN